MCRERRFSCKYPFFISFGYRIKHDKSNVFESALFLAMRIPSAPIRRYRSIVTVNRSMRTKFTPDTVIRMIYDVAAISFLLVWAPISSAAGLGLTVNEITPMDQGDEKDLAPCWLGFSTDRKSVV